MSTVGTGLLDLTRFEEITHHEKGKDQTGREQRNSEDQTHAAGSAESEADDQASDKQQQANRNAERKAISAIKGTPRTRTNRCFLRLHLQSPLNDWLDLSDSYSARLALVNDCLERKMVGKTQPIGWERGRPVRTASEARHLFRA